MHLIKIKTEKLLNTRKIHFIEVMWLSVKLFELFTNEGLRKPCAFELLELNKTF